jgi:hypothetical protein
MKISGYSLKKPKMTMINSFHDSKLTNPYPTILAWLLRKCRNGQETPTLKETTKRTALTHRKSSSLLSLDKQKKKENTDSKAENQPTEIPSTAYKPCSQDKPYPSTEEVL